LTRFAKRAPRTFSEASGTNGLAGAADATLVLKRPQGQADAVPYVTGRDVDESEYALRFVGSRSATNFTPLAVAALIMLLGAV
jgi:hypothetical protein